MTCNRPFSELLAGVRPTASAVRTRVGRVGGDLSVVADPAHVPADADRPIRADLVAQVRARIAAGEYDTPERWDAALDRLADALIG